MGRAGNNLWPCLIYHRLNFYQIHLISSRNANKRNKIFMLQDWILGKPQAKLDSREERKYTPRRERAGNNLWPCLIYDGLNFYQIHLISCRYANKRNKIFTLQDSILMKQVSGVIFKPLTKFIQKLWPCDSWKKTKRLYCCFPFYLYLPPPSST